MVIVGAAASAVSCSRPSDDGTSSSASKSKDPTEVTVAWPGASSAFGYMIVAKEEGFFEKNGLKVTMKVVSNEAMVPGLVSGALQAIPTAGSAERAALQGQPIVNLVNMMTTSTAGLIVRAGINSPADLRGKTIVSAPSSATPNQQLHQWLDETGLTDSVKVLALETLSSQSAAFVSGQADGMFLNFDTVVKAQTQVPGSKILVTPKDIARQGAQAGLAVSENLLKDHPDTVESMLRAIYEADKFVLSEPEKTKATFAKELQMTPDQSDYAYNQITPLVVLQAKPTTEQLQNNAESDSKTLKKTVTVEDLDKVWDTALAEKVFAELKCPEVCTAR